MLKRKLLSVGLLLVALLTLVACSQPRNDLQVSDFPSIGSGLTKSQLEQAVGKPHYSSSSSLEILDMMTFLLYQPIEVDGNWNINDRVDKFYVYDLEGGDSAMIALIVDDKVVEITTQAVRID